MPTHWESSTRPLFVRTVVVNGSRHAILTPEDPLAQNLALSKHSRPPSPQGSTASSPSNPDHLSKDEKGKSKAPRDLQSCLVKLQMVLATQEARKPANSGGKQSTGPASKKRKHSLKNDDKKRECDSTNKTSQRITESTVTAKVLPAKTQVLDINQNITVASFFMEPKTHHCSYYIGEQKDRISGYSNLSTYNPNDKIDVFSTAPTLGMSADYDVPWNVVSADNYYTRPFYNRLSDRVLQWLDLSRRNCPQTSPVTDVPKAEPKTGRNRPDKKTAFRTSSEDNSDAVRTDEDVETALSTEVPKFAQELNRQHYLKTTIPTKQQDYPRDLQESIANCFRSAISNQGKSCEEPRYKATSARSRSYLKGQGNELESSDDEPEAYSWEIIKQKNARRVKHAVHREHPRYVNPLDCFRQENKSDWSHTVRWPCEQETKPQLHIFIPTLPDVQQISDTESVLSDDA